MAKDPIKKATNGTYYFRANLGKHPVTGKQIQKYRSGFATKKEARAEYSKLILSTPDELTEKKEEVTFKKFIQEIYLPWYKTQVKESTYKNRCIFRKNCASVPEERSAIPLQTEQSSAG